MSIFDPTDLRRLAVSGKHRAPHMDQTIMGAVARPLKAAATRGSLRRELGATLALGWPIVLANLAINVMTVTDFIMLGRLSPHALAAGSLGFFLYQPLFLFGLGVVGALSPIASRIRSVCQR